MKRLALWAVMGAVSAAFAADPNTWWVDDDCYGAAVQDGSETHPFGTILAAVTNEACKAGDTIKVKPGVYDKDYYEGSYTAGGTTYIPRMRVYIGKRVNIVATGSKEETHIVGRFCPVEEGGNATYHSGATAIRCVHVGDKGRGSTLTGFTLRDGATIDYRGSGLYSCGGAIGVYANDSNFYVTDCVISNCVGRYYGGASYGGTFNRCLFYGCWSYASSAALYRSYAINSVFVGCQLMDSKYITVCSGDNENSKVVNCTIYGNKSARVVTEDCYNCLFVGNGSVETNGIAVQSSNVYASPGKDYCNEPNEFPLYAPHLGDYHPLAGSAAIGAGDPSKLAIIPLPAGMELRDMDGNLIDTNAVSVTAGAY